MIRINLTKRDYLQKHRSVERGKIKSENEDRNREFRVCNSPSFDIAGEKRPGRARVVARGEKVHRYVFVKR